MITIFKIKYVIHIVLLDIMINQMQCLVISVLHVHLPVMIVTVLHVMLALINITQIQKHQHVQPVIWVINVSNVTVLMEYVCYVQRDIIEMVTHAKKYPQYVEMVCIIHQKDVMMVILYQWMVVMRNARLNLIGIVYYMIFRDLMFVS